MTAFYIAIFGLVGIFLRYGADIFIGERFPNFPVSTLIVNVVGCFAAGCIYVLGSREILSAQIQTVLLVGLCGGFTTFSAYALQNLLLTEKSAVHLMLINLIGSPLLGFAAVYLGYIGTKFLVR